MQCVALQSRLIASVAYYRSHQRLRVWFRGRGCAVHHGISEAMFRNLIEAESPGFYYRQYIADRGVHRSSGLRPRTKLMISLGASAFMLAVSQMSLTTGSERATHADGRLACGFDCPGHSVR